MASVESELELASMPFKRAVWLQLARDAGSDPPVQFQCPLSGQFGCNADVSSARSSVVAFQCPLSGQFGCNADRSSARSSVVAFQCPLSGQFGCNFLILRTTKQVLCFNAL